MIARCVRCSLVGGSSLRVFGSRDPGAFLHPAQMPYHPLKLHHRQNSRNRRCRKPAAVGQFVHVLGGIFQQVEEHLLGGVGGQGAGRLYVLGHHVHV